MKHDLKVIGPRKNCSLCGKQLRIDNKFGMCWSHPETPAFRMKETRRRSTYKSSWIKIKAKIDNIKIKTGCVDCGYNKDPVALDFDHLPEFEKLFEIGSGKIRSESLIDAEIAKCEVVCANCHRIRTKNRRQQEMRISE